MNILLDGFLERVTMTSLRSVKNYFKEVRNQNHELIWARTWDDTKRGIDWAENLPGISPGRWAVGYNYLYMMTRILNEMEPRAVLDMGLGISSTLISHYFAFKKYSDGLHDIIEQDPEWIEFYQKKHELPAASTIHICPSVEKELNGRVYNAYSGFEEVIAGKKYDVISIDGPKGTPFYSRRDVLPFLPGILKESFVIIMDDSTRSGEQATIKEITSILKSNGIETCRARYPGGTDCTIITSTDRSFFCTM